MKETFSVSIDVEDLQSPHAPCDLIFGKIGQQALGIPLIMDTCEKAGVKATFFLDAFNSLANQPIELFCDAAQEIVRRGHELALHTHPPKGGSLEYVTWFDSPTGYLANYDLDHQYRLLSDAIERFVSWTGESPRSHRAGSYGANADTFRALEKVGIRIDSSIFWGIQSMIDSTSEYYESIAPFMFGNILEIPVTTYNLQLTCGALHTKLNKKMDITWASSGEIADLLALHTPHVDLFLHSYSLIDLSKKAINQHALQNLKRSLELLTRARTNVRIAHVQASQPFKKPTLKRSLFDDSWTDFQKIYLSKLNANKIKKIFFGKGPRLIGRETRA